MIDTKESVFWKEIFEQPEAVRNCLKENEPVLREIAKEVKVARSKRLFLWDAAPAITRIW